MFNIFGLAKVGVKQGTEPQYDKLPLQRNPCCNERNLGPMLVIKSIHCMPEDECKTDQLRFIQTLKHE